MTLQNISSPSCGHISKHCLTSKRKKRAIYFTGLVANLIDESVISSIYVSAYIFIYMELEF